MEKEKPVIRHRMGSYMRRTLITGILLLVPIALTYLVIRLIFDLVNGVLQPGAEWIVSKLGFDWTMPGLGIVLAVILIYFAAFFLANAMGRKMVGWGQAVVQRVPLVGPIYTASRKLVESFSSKGSRGLKRVVLVEYPRRGAWSIGFLTAITSTEKNEQLAVVYIPTAPLPNSGWVAVVPFDEVLDTDLSVPAAMQLVFSGGIISPAKIKTFKLENVAELPTGPSGEA